MTLALVQGPARHGVTRHALTMAAAANMTVINSCAQVVPGEGVHIDFTDRLFGNNTTDSAANLASGLAALGAANAPLVATLHDVPVPGSPSLYDRRRQRLYAQICAAAVGAIVSSWSELRRLRMINPSVPAAVVPLPVSPVLRAGRPTAVLPARGPVSSVCVLGFVYPGKGHQEVQKAMAHAGLGLALTCVGEASLGHEDLARELATHPGTTVTGFVADGALAQYLGEQTLPVAPHRQVSASGSIATWWSYRRRPLAPRNAYTEELLCRNPGSLVLYDTDLAAALKQAAADPGTTWLPDDLHPGPTLFDAATQRGSIIAGWVE